MTHRRLDLSLITARPFQTWSFSPTFRLTSFKNEFYQILYARADLVEIKIMPVLEFGLLIEDSISEDPEEPTHPHSLARAIAARINIARTYM